MGNHDVWANDIEESPISQEHSDFLDRKFLIDGLLMNIRMQPVGNLSLQDLDYIQQKPVVDDHSALASYFYNEERVAKLTCILNKAQGYKPYQ